METVRTKYLGELRTEATHVRSGNRLITDAPVDNRGKGEYFSPTDLVATSLGSCMMTIMGIASNEHGFSIDGVSCRITKIMADNPRRVGEIVIELDFTMRDYTDKQKKILDYCAKTCPVSQTLHPSVIQNVKFLFRD
ncbi:MAG: OsmC family protein [Bacteroidales bacterium]